MPGQSFSGEDLPDDARDSDGRESKEDREARAALEGRLREIRAKLAEEGAKPRVGQIYEPRPVDVDVDELARQAELDEVAARLRAEDTERLTKQEAANYAASHAIIERDEDGNPIRPSSDNEE